MRNNKIDILINTTNVVNISKSIGLGIEKFTKKLLSVKPDLIIETGVAHGGSLILSASILELMATTSEYNSKFQSFVMLDDGTNGDAMANDGIYSVELPFQSSGIDVKFYIILLETS